MALRDSGCNTTLMDENLAAALVAKKWILKFKALIRRKHLPRSTSTNAVLLELEERKSSTYCVT